MNPVQPQIHGHEALTFAKDQPEYVPLPAVVYSDEQEVQHVLTRWSLTDEERAAIAAGADVWLDMMTFGYPLQPVRLTVECPIEPKGEPS